MPKIKELYLQIIKKSKARDDVGTLTKIPPKEIGSNMPKYQILKEGYLSQCDLLFLPHDKFGFKYCLVVVDGCSKKLDAEPIKNKDSATIIRAFKKIYERKILTYPTIISSDPGSEFKNKEVKQYFTDNDVYVKYGMVNRHRQQSLVEFKNYILGVNLNGIMTAKEIETGKTSRQWKIYVRDLVDLINENLPKPKKKAISDSPIITKENQTLLNEGQKVRVALDYPQSASDNSRLHGKWRAGDIRWSKKEEFIEQINIRPGYPPLYKIHGYNGVNFTRQQIQPVI